MVMAENKECIIYLMVVDDEYYEDDTKSELKVYMDVTQIISHLNS